MKALEPIQVIATESGGPYAFRTRLGWCIVGPIMNGNNKDSISCRRVAVRDASASQVALHHFEIKDSIKDIILKEMLKMIQKNEFSEPGLPSSKIMMRSSEVSVEDQKFLHILEKGTVMKDDHYVVPLLFQDTAFKFQLSCYWPSFCPCRTLKTSFTSAMPWQSFC